MRSFRYKPIGLLPTYGQIKCEN